MEVATEIEDDLFFADLSKQISLLIMDDDDKLDPVSRCPSVSFQGFSRASYPSVPSPYLSEQACKKESKGTGVFIPRSSQPRKKHKQGRFGTSQNSKPHHHRQLDHNNNTTTRMISHQLSYNNSFDTQRR